VGDFILELVNLTNFSSNMKIFAIFFVILTFAQKPCWSYNKTIFTISAGDKSGTYFAIATKICDEFNRNYSDQKIHCRALESKGSRENLEKLANQEVDFAIIKSLEFNDKFIGNAKFLHHNIKEVGKIHDEYLTFVVPKNSNIKSISNLNNKTVNIGSIGSTSELMVGKYFFSNYIRPKKIVNYSASESFTQICNRKIDAWLYFIGHPNDGFNEMLKKCDVEIVSLNTKEIKQFKKQFGFLESKILDQQLYETINQDIPTVCSATFLARRNNLDDNITNMVKQIIIDLNF